MARAWARRWLLLPFALPLAWLAWRVFDWAVLQAAWQGEQPAACEAVTGACWPVLRVKLGFMLFGLYPVDQRWRAGLALLLFGLTVALALWRKLPLGVRLLQSGIGCAVCGWLLAGGAGLVPVASELWGGLPVSLMLASLGMAGALPLGLALALARRATHPLPRWLAIGYIELVRGVPLLAVLFMATVMFALLLPEGQNWPKLARVQLAIVLFTAAYVAEAIRGGLQAVPTNQYDCARALGFSHWGAMRHVVLPQALRTAVPALANSAISLLKDTSLVVIVGVYDFAFAVKKATEIDLEWRPYFLETYLFALAVYWLLCRFASRAAARLEARPA